MEHAQALLRIACDTGIIRIQIQKQIPKIINDSVVVGN